MASTEIIGVQQMRQAFDGLKHDMRTSIGRRMVVAGGRVVREQAIANARANGSVRTGAMVANIAIKREKNAPDGTEQYHIGVRHGRDQSRKVRKAATKRLVSSRGRVRVVRENDPYYWRWVERGRRVVPRSAQDGTTTYTQRLRNGKVVVRTRKFAGSSIRARRKLAGAAQVGAKPFLEPALAQRRHDALQAMQRTAQLALKRYGLK